LPASSDAKAKAKGNAKGTKQIAKTKSKRGGAGKKGESLRETRRQRVIQAAAAAALRTLLKPQPTQNRLSS
jgi:hypothetical protein